MLRTNVASTSRRWSLGVLATALAVTIPLIAVQSAVAVDNTPPWEPSSGGGAIGTLIFYDSTGAVITGGQLSARPFASYVEASAAGRDGDTKATLYGFTPKLGEDPGLWSFKQLSLSTNYPNSSAPDPIKTATNPVVSVSSTDANLQDMIATNPNTETDSGYANRYQMRVVTSAPGSTNDQYFDADIQVDTSAGTWTEIYPDQGSAGQSTTTVLTASPTGSETEGQTVTLTATETAADSSHPGGSVTFKSDGITIGNPVAVDSSGVAMTATAGLPAGNQTLTATFAPSGSGSVGSTGTLPYRVNPVAKTPTISGTTRVGHTVKCVESKDFGVTASYEWLLNGKKSASGVSYKIPASAYKKKLTCEASVSATGGPTSSKTSKASTVGTGSALSARHKPGLSGTPKAHHKEKVKTGSWSPTAKSYSFQWLINGKSVKHATKSSFTVPSKDKGKKLSCKVTAKAPGYASGHATTKAKKIK